MEGWHPLLTAASSPHAHRRRGRNECGGHARLAPWLLAAKPTQLFASSRCVARSCWARVVLEPVSGTEGPEEPGSTCHDHGAITCPAIPHHTPVFLQSLTLGGGRCSPCHGGLWAWSWYSLAPESACCFWTIESFPCTRGRLYPNCRTLPELQPTEHDSNLPQGRDPRSEPLGWLWLGSGWLATLRLASLPVL